MRRSQFAELIGVSKQQVSKYVADGAVVLEGSAVVVDASLAALEGRLDESKRQKALALVAERPMISGLLPPSAPKSLSGKARHDEARAELAELELAKRKGELVEASDVEQRAEEAVMALRETMIATRREDADVICAKFGIPADRATALARELSQRDDRALSRFAAAMEALASAAPAQGANAVRTEALVA